MTVLIDPPVWPAHGTVFSHLVSDTSLIELREFARAAGVPDRAFDLDHYDVAAFRYNDLIEAGAVPVVGTELARRLKASGLRIPGNERHGSKRDALLRRWDGLAPGAAPSVRQHSEDATVRVAGRPREDESPEHAAWHAVGEDLLGRWQEPHRTYHTAFHLASALDALDLLLSDAEAAGEPVPAEIAWHARIALWFHDAVHEGSTPADEESSAALVATLPAPLAASVTREIARAVMVTAGHDPEAGDLTGCLVSDADLAILGGSPAAYARYTHQVRAEYAHVPDPLFRQGRAEVLRSLIANGDIYRTSWAKNRWQEAATRNLETEITTLQYADAG